VQVLVLIAAFASGEGRCGTQQDKAEGRYRRNGKLSHGSSNNRPMRFAMSPLYSGQKARSLAFWSGLSIPKLQLPGR
jgi:hypothetical protein